MLSLLFYEKLGSPYSAFQASAARIMRIPFTSHPPGKTSQSAQEATGHFPASNQHQIWIISRGPYLLPFPALAFQAGIDRIVALGIDIRHRRWYSIHGGKNDKPCVLAVCRVAGKYAACLAAIYSAFRWDLLYS